MERAIDVLAVAAQKSAATFGRGHPQAKAAFAGLATAEFEAARASGDAARLARAVDLVAAAGRQSEASATAQRKVPAAPHARTTQAGPYPRTAAGAPHTRPAPSTQERVAAPPGHVDEVSAGVQQGAAATRLFFTVLGPVRGRQSDTPLRTGSPQQRALLAILLLRGGRTATAAELVEAIWGDEPPQGAMAALRTYASRLRKALGTDAGVLVSESGGYALCSNDSTAIDLDVDRAERYAAEAERARAAGDRVRARDLLDAALACWDGESLASLPGAYLKAQRQRLEEWRLALTESRLDLALELGDHAAAVSELTALTAAHPLREGLRELLMLALYRSGRQAEALAVYADTRRLLADELGMDPRRSLSDLQMRILQADPELAEPDTEPGDETRNGPFFVRPQQLPATVPDFIGRAALTAELGDRLAAAEGVMAVTAIAGLAGSGKTTLAVHVAHAAREHFPDGQLYADLHGTGREPAEPQAVLGAFLRVLGTPDSQIPDGLDDRAALYRSMLQGRRLLVLLDNARSAAQVRSLLPGTEGCAALITSRTRMVDLAGAHLVDLDVMSPEEALGLFTLVVGEERVVSEREAAMDVVAACGFLPLAIRIVAARLAARRTWTVSVLAAKLADKRRRLDELQAGDVAVKATFELGYGGLNSEEARAFRLLGTVDGPDLSLGAAAAVLGLPQEAAEILIESLVDVSLLESAGPGRYRIHDLVRLFAHACAERDEAASEPAAALSRVLDFYVATAARAHALERPGDRLPHDIEQTRYPGLDFEHHDAAQSWLFAESRCLMAAAEQAAGQGDVRRAADLLLLCRDLSESGAGSVQYERACNVVLDAAHVVEDQRAQARVHLALTGVCITAGRFPDAVVNAEAAVLIAHSAQDSLTEFRALHEAGVIATVQRRPAEAEEYLQRALVAYRADNDREAEAGVLCDLSRVHLDTGRTDSAIRLAEQGLAIYRRLGSPRRSAYATYMLGLAFARAERLEDAARELREATSVFGDGRQRFWEGMAYFRLAEVELTADRAADAANYAEQALTALRGIGGDWWRATVLTTLGRALHRIGHSSRAQVCWQEALSVFERLGAQEAAEITALLDPRIVA
ncbi:BTAD domain-containing putative transcriptional regulator [Streptomyces violens]|uniref:AfsR/SARP family transcriptional regulator n=1 Tax=Streptomyces violens TaxID=66377 RepID=UPI0009988164